MTKQAKELGMLKEVDRLNRIPSASPEQGVIRTYVDWLITSRGIDVVLLTPAA